MTDDCTCPDGCLCTKCPTCRVQRVDSHGNLVDADDPTGATLANVYGRNLSHDDVVRKMREEDVEADLELAAVGEPEEAEWGDDPDPNAWGLHPIPVDRDRIVYQGDVVGREIGHEFGIPEEQDDHRFRVTLEILGEDDEVAPADSVDDDVTRETTWE